MTQFITTKSYVYPISKKENEINELIIKRFPFIHYAIWHSKNIREFTRHQSYDSFIIIETEQAVTESVFNYLKEKFDNIYLKPKQKFVERYLLDLPQAIIIQNLPTESPLKKVERFPTISLEKMLVDVFTNYHLFYFYADYELIYIFQNAFEKYPINRKKLLRYAKRRNRKRKIEAFINRLNINTA